MAEEVKRGRGRPRKDQGKPANEADENLIQLFKVTKAVAEFEKAVMKEMKEHPNNKADAVVIEEDYIYVVLNRVENGIHHSLDIEVKFDE